MIFENGTFLLGGVVQFFFASTLGEESNFILKPTIFQPPPQLLKLITILLGFGHNRKHPKCVVFLTGFYLNTIFSPNDQ